MSFYEKRCMGIIINKAYFSNSHARKFHDLVYYKIMSGATSESLAECVQKLFSLYRESEHDLRGVYCTKGIKRICVSVVGGENVEQCQSKSVVRFWLF